MPISYSVDEKHGQIFTTVTGRISPKEIVDHFESVRQKRLLDLAELVDARQAAAPYLNTNDVWGAANSVRATRVTQSFGPRAVIVNNLTTFGLVRIFAQIMSGHVPMNVFRDEAIAVQWLAVQPRPQRAIQPPPTTKSS